MAVSLTATKVVSFPVILLTDNMDKGGKKWCVEIWDIVAGPSNDGTSKEITSGLSCPLFVAILDKTSSLSSIATGATISGSTVTIKFASAPQSTTHRVKIEGYL